MTQERLIKFTQREIDVIACILKGRGVKKISSLLLISPKTTDVHMRNIMSKIGCNSKEGIIDYIEKSSLLPSINQRYNKISEIPEINQAINEKDNNLNFMSYVKSIETENIPVTAKFSDTIKFLHNDKKDASLYNKIFINLALYPKITLLKVTSLGVIFSCLTIIFVNVFKNKDNYEENSKSSKAAYIRSEIILPQDSHLLQRSALLSKIEEKFKSQKAIKIVVLLGATGAGKTTLARQYAQDKNAPVLWEINAENKNDLILSFENLAYALTQTEADKITLKEIEETSNHNKREIKLFMYIKTKLLDKPNWTLIYDKVEDFHDIEKYFPYDSKVWGKGRVIITTNNSMISNNHYIGDDKVIKVGELSPEEKFTLFTKIIFSDKSFFLSSNNEQKIREFLEKLPSLPSHVSSAAYCLKYNIISNIYD